MMPPISPRRASTPASRIPAYVASLEARSSSSNCGSNAIVNALSMMYPTSEFDRILTVHLRAEVKLHNVALIEHRVVAGVRRVVSGTVVDRAASREAHTRQGTVLLDQMADAIFHIAANVVQLHPGFDFSLDVRTGLAVHFSRFSVAFYLIFVARVADASFLTRINSLK